jgi:hypothetical protein
MHRGKSEGACIRRSTRLFVGPFVLVSGLWRLFTVVVVTKSFEDWLWISYGVSWWRFIFVLDEDPKCVARAIEEFAETRI